jgi:hypothetical protein
MAWFSKKDQTEPGSDFMFVCQGELVTSCQEIFAKLIYIQYF